MGEYSEKQFRIIRDPDNEEETKVPVMPLIVVLNDGTIGETKSIRGLMSLIVGNEYMDAEDPLDDWHLRVRAARSESMKAIARGINAIVYDKRNKENNGVINNNYASIKDDSDYEDEESNENKYKIRVEGEKVFLLSLVQIGAIKVLERQDSHLIRPLDNTCAHRCTDCIYKEIREKDKNVCSIYSSLIEKDEGADCESYGNSDSNVKEYKGGTYIDIAQECNIEELISVYEKYIR